MTQTSETPSCGNCIYWNAYRGQDDTGECRRFPPVIVDIDRSYSPIQATPMVHNWDWCGEHKPEAKP